MYNAKSKNRGFIKCSLLTDLRTKGIPSLVVGPTPTSNFRGPKSTIFLGCSLSDSFVYSCFIWYTRT